MSTAQHTPGPLTLRKLIELVGPEFMDAELSVTMKGAAGRTTAWAPLPTDLHSMPRVAAHAGTGEPARLMFSIHARGVRFVKVAKAIGSEA